MTLEEEKKAKLPTAQEMASTIDWSQYIDMDKVVSDLMGKQGVPANPAPANDAATSANTTTSSNTTNNNTSSQGSYSGSDTVQQAYLALQNQLNNSPGAYRSKWQSQMDEIMNAYRNREDFQYDLDSDALYQQYADQYARKGQLAMMDTMGQAAALTGGYGSSYAVTAGNQAYQGYLQQLNDVVPELYGMAYDRYNQEGEDMLTEYSLLSAREDEDYAKYKDDLSKYYAELDYLTGRYDTAVANEQWNKEFNYETQPSDSSNSNKNAYVVGNTGNDPDVNEQTTKEISSGITNKAASFTNNKDLASYLDGLVASGSITEPQADSLFAEYMTPEQAKLKDRTWTLKDDGGVNWFWGIDNNATVKDNYGNVYRLDKLKDALVAEGMSKSEAKEYVKKLQKSLGA